MSGIFGIVHFDGRQVDRELIARMGAASRVRAVDGEAHWIEGSAGIGHQHSRVTPESATERQPVVTPDVVISFDGRLDNRDDLVQSSGVESADARLMSDAEVVLAVYRAAGDRCCGMLCGDFAFALFDRAANRLLLARDIMAARPLYYASHHHGVLFASEMKCLLAHPGIEARPDEDGLADLVLNGYWDGHTTWFDGIRSVPPGSLVSVTARGVSIGRAWDFDDREIRYRSASEYGDHFRALFSQAVKRRLRSAHPVAVSVSGGVDSSAIQCEAVRLASVPVRGITMAYPRGTAADEHEYVDALRRDGLQVDAVPVDVIRWLVCKEGSAGRMEMPALFWIQHDQLLSRARQAGCRVLLSGFFGDQVLTGNAYVVDLISRGRLGRAHRHMREAARWMVDVDPRALYASCFRTAIRNLAPAWALKRARVVRARHRTPAGYPPWFAKRFADRAAQRAIDRAHRPKRFPSAHQEEFWRIATSGYYLATLAQSSSAGVAHQLETTFPFRDRELVAFLMAVPGDVVCLNGVPKGLLRETMAGVLPEPIRLRRDKGDGTGFSNAAALAEETTVRRLLGSDSLAARLGLIDPAALRSRLPAIFGKELRRNDSARLGWQIGDTVALELWLNRFCAGVACN